MGIILMALMGVILAIYGFIVKFSKKISLIPAITEERLKKIKKIDKVANDFGNRLLLIALAFIITAIATYYFGTVGSIVGFILIIVATVNWNSASTSVEEKIKKREY